MKKSFGPMLSLVFITACGSAAVKNSNSSSGAAKTPSSAQASQVSALFAGQMASAASSQGSSKQSKAAKRAAAAMDPVCTGNDPTAAMNDPNCVPPGASDPNCTGNDPTAAMNDPNCSPPPSADPNCSSGNPAAASDPNCGGGGGGIGIGAGGSQTISLPSITVPCEGGGNVVQSGNMTFSESFGTGSSSSFSMSGSIDMDAVYHSCAMPTPDGNTYTMDAPSGVAQDMNMSMSFSGLDPSSGQDPNNSGTPGFPQMSMTSTVVGDNITVYAKDGSVVASGSVNLSMSITLDPNGAGYVHFSGTQFGLAVDANQTFTPPTMN